MKPRQTTILNQVKSNKNKTSLTPKLTQKSQTTKEKVENYSEK